jgi:hypothetical protein
VKRLQSILDRFLFHLTAREKVLLFEIMKLYPLLPSSHAKLHRKANNEQFNESQELLEESLAEERNKNKSYIKKFLEDSHRFKTAPGGYHMALSHSELEWLLQVLNDVRIGSWVKLGSPEDHQRKTMKVTEQNSIYLLAMDVCAYFQSILVE